MKDYFVGRGFLHPEKLKIAEKYRGKPLVDAEGATEHKGVLEIRLCPYMYYCMLNGQMGWGSPFLATTRAFFCLFVQIDCLPAYRTSAFFVLCIFIQH